MKTLDTYLAASTGLGDLLDRMLRIDGTPADKRGEANYASLPVFGGEEPRNTTAVWSWDEKNLLVGACTRELEIISRDEYFTE